MITNEELLAEINKLTSGKKSIFTDSDLTSDGGLLDPKQFDKFIDETLERTVMRAEARHESGVEKAVDLDKIAFSDLLIQTPSSEGTKHTTTTEPETTQVQISVIDYIIAVNLGYSALKNSIAKGNFENNLMKLISAKSGSDLEAVAVNSNTSTGSGVYDDNAGWFQLGATDHEVDHESAEFTSTADETITLFDNMLDALPKKYLDGTDVGAWRFYVHVDIEWLYRRWLTAIGNSNSAAMNYLIDKPPVFYQGIPVIGVPRLSRTTAGTPSYYLSNAMLVHPQNLIEYFQEEVRFTTESIPRARELQITGLLAVDWQIEETDACVVAKDIKHSLGTS